MKTENPITRFKILSSLLILIILSVDISSALAFDLPSPESCKGSRVPEGTNSFKLDSISQARVNRLVKTRGCVPAGTKLVVIGKIRGRGKLGFDSLDLSVRPFNFREDGKSQSTEVPLINLENGTYSAEIRTPKHTGPTGLNEPQGVSSAVYDSELGFNKTKDGYTSYCNMKNTTRIRFRACMNR